MDEKIGDAERGTSRRGLLRGALAAGLGGVASRVLAAPGRGSALAVATSGRLLKAQAAQKEYWIQADTFQHNYVPSGFDPLIGNSYTPDQTSAVAIGYRAYTPGWGEPLAGNDDIGPNSGVPGPVIRAEVGQTVVIHFRNNDQNYGWPHSMHFHGFRYAPSSDGAYQFQNGEAPGTVVRPGDSYDYVFHAMPTSVGTWVYHDHSMPETLDYNRHVAGGAGSRGIGTRMPASGTRREIGMPDTDGDGDGTMPTQELLNELGLVGMVAITDANTPQADREFFVLLQDLYAADIPSLAQDLDLINGYAFIGNTPTFTARVGDRIRWRVGTLSKEFHVFHVHGHRWLHAGDFVDAVVLGPSTTLTAEYVEDAPGTWLYHCHVPDHMMGGMIGEYVVAAPTHA